MRIKILSIKQRNSLELPPLGREEGMRPREQGERPDSSVHEGGRIGNWCPGQQAWGQGPFLR